MRNVSVVVTANAARSVVVNVNCGAEANIKNTNSKDDTVDSDSDIETMETMDYYRDHRSDHPNGTDTKHDDHHDDDDDDSDDEEHGSAEHGPATAKGHEDLPPHCKRRKHDARRHGNVGNNKVGSSSSCKPDLKRKQK